MNSVAALDGSLTRLAHVVLQHGAAGYGWCERPSADCPCAYVRSRPRAPRWWTSARTGAGATAARSPLRRRCRAGVGRRRRSAARCHSGDTSRPPRFRRAWASAGSPTIARSRSALSLSESVRDVPLTTCQLCVRAKQTRVVHWWSSGSVTGDGQLVGLEPFDHEFHYSRCLFFALGPVGCPPEESHD